jgi:hypothetical protein
VKIEFSTDNAAFEDDFGGEVERILCWIAEQVKYDRTGGNIRDLNGNTVGSWAL